MGSFKKPRQPIPNEFEPAPIDVVYAIAPLLVVMKQTRRLQQLYMPRSSRPGMLENVGDFARSHRSALEVEREQDSTAHRVGERGEHGLVRVRPGLRLLPQFAFLHGGIYLAYRLSIVKRYLAYGLSNEECVRFSKVRWAAVSVAVAQNTTNQPRYSG